MLTRERRTEPSGMVRRLMVGAVAAVIVGGGVTAGISSASASASNGSISDPSPSTPKSQLPANINPDKTPNLNPPLSALEVSVPKSPAEQLQEAKQWAATDPGSSVICFKADGTVAGVAMVDKADKTAPVRDTNKICNFGWKGSHS
jgi:hypothetical protein